METKTPGKCQNCGAGLEKDASKCPYCGTNYDTAASNPSPAAEKEGDGESISQSNSDTKIPGKPQILPAGCGVLFLFAVIGLVIAATINKQTGWGNGAFAPKYEEPYSTVDAVAKALTQDSIRYEKKIIVELAFTLRKLAPIKIDTPKFDKLFADARKKHLQDLSTSIYDESSPEGVNEDGIFAYVNKSGSSPELWFSIQYTDEDWLSLKSVTFTADGENFDYKPDFNQGNADSYIWEYSNEILHTWQIPMLVKIASSKKVKVRLNGDKKYKIINMTRDQRQAIKRILQIYKGLLLKYDENNP